jgi:SAM-dependent methyltransferase
VHADNVEAVSDASIPLTPGSSPRAVSPVELAAIRRSRRRPRRTQFDYLHVRYLVRDLEAALGRIEGPVRDVLDVWCGSRPYDDLLPAGAHSVGLDVEGNPYGVADVVSNDLVPFPDESFDLVVCIEAFQWMRDPTHTVAEFRRVLRPGGTALIAVPYAFEYDRANFERRFTGNELLELFDGWDDVVLLENGGRGVAWTVLTNSLLSHAVTRAGFPGLQWIARGVYALLNPVGIALEHLEARHAGGTVTFPMNLLVTARKPH